jgi:hypothetical protein
MASRETEFPRGWVADTEVFVGALKLKIPRLPLWIVRKRPYHRDIRSLAAWERYIAPKRD